MKSCDTIMKRDKWSLLLTSVTGPLSKSCSRFKSFKHYSKLFRIYSVPKVIVMFMSEELIGALHALFRAHDFKVFEHVIKRKWCFSPLLILLMWYIRKQFFTSVSVEMFIWLLEFYVISFSLFALSLPLHRGYFFALKDVFH